MRAAVGIGLIMCAAACSSFGSDAGSGAGTGTGTGADGGAGADGGGTSPAEFSCADHPSATLCDDFEGRTKVDLKWTSSSATPALATAPALDTQAAASGTASATMEVGALPSGQNAKSLLEDNVDAHTDGDVHVEYEVRVDAFGANDSIWFSRLAFGNTDNGSGYRIWLYAEKGIYYVAQQGANTTSSPKEKLPVEVTLGKWLHVVLDVSFQQKTIRATLGGSPVTVSFVPEAVSGPLIFSAGIDYVEGVTERVAVHYDNVVLESH